MHEIGQGPSAQGLVLLLIITKLFESSFVTSPSSLVTRLEGHQQATEGGTRVVINVELALVGAL